MHDSAQPEGGMEPGQAAAASPIVSWGMRGGFCTQPWENKREGRSGGPWPCAPAAPLIAPPDPCATSQRPPCRIPSGA